MGFSITYGILSSKVYDKRDGFNFEIVHFPFLDEDVPRSPSYGVYISQLIRFVRICLMLMNSTTETHFCSEVIKTRDTINFVKLLLHFVIDTQILLIHTLFV